jgi:phage gp29-like protein
MSDVTLYDSTGQRIRNAAPRRRKSATSIYLQLTQLERKQDLVDLRIAIDQAENVNSYDRSELLDVYRRTERDLNITAQWETRKLKTIEKEFIIVDEQGNEFDKLYNVFESGWFYDWLNNVLDAKLYGFSLVEFGHWDSSKRRFTDYEDGKGRFRDAVELVDRRFVKPEFDAVVKNFSDRQGVSISQGPYSKNLMLIGKRHNLGLLLKLSMYALIKENGLLNWSEWAEVFGMDTRWIQSDAEGAERRQLEESLRKIGSGAYGIFPADVELNYTGVQRSDAYNVYHKLADYVDQQVSKAIFGQDVVTNNTGRVVGEVGENVSNLYGRADARLVKTVINDKLFPMLSTLGVETEGKQFKWKEEEDVDARSQVDLRISQMGKRLSDDYIRETYGVETEDAEVSTQEAVEDTIRNLKALQELYGISDK